MYEDEHPGPFYIGVPSLKDVKSVMPKVRQDTLKFVIKYLIMTNDAYIVVIVKSRCKLGLLNKFKIY